MNIYPDITFEVYENFYIPREEISSILINVNLYFNVNLDSYSFLILVIQMEYMSQIVDWIMLRCLGDTMVKTSYFDAMLKEWICLLKGNYSLLSILWLHEL